MRIISGYLGGREFLAPKGHKTHPMSEKMRGAMFNMLGDIGGLSILDAYAGSGAISFEAISRGANKSIAIDSDKNAAQTMKDSASKLAVDDKVKVIRANALSWSDNNIHEKFDMVILDPPYDKVNPGQLVKLSAHTKLNGLVVMSLPPKNKVKLDPKIYTKLDSKEYGDSTLVFYRRIQ